MKPTEKILKNKRRAYKRVSMKNSSFTCHVEAGDYLCKVINLSLSGCYLECPNELQEGDTSTVIITSKDDIFSTPLILSGKVVRVSKNGVALNFIESNENDYMMLQAILLYYSQEPYVMAIEFPEQLHLAIDQ